MAAFLPLFHSVVLIGIGTDRMGSFPGLNKAFSSIRRINKDDVASIAPRGIDRDHEQRMFEDFRHAVYGAFLEEQHLAPPHLKGLTSPMKKRPRPEKMIRYSSQVA